MWIRHGEPEARDVQRWFHLKTNTATQSGPDFHILVADLTKIVRIQTTEAEAEFMLLLINFYI